MYANPNTHRQTNKHEYPIVSALEKIIVAVSFFSKLGYTLPYSEQQSSTLPEITSGIF